MNAPPPMYVRDLPEGWRVALCHTGSGNPPGFHGGMATCSSELWCRLINPAKVDETTGADGWDSGWHRVTVSRSMVAAAQWWNLVESYRDIKDAWIGCVGEPWPPPRYDAVYFHGTEWLTALGAR